MVEEFQLQKEKQLKRKDKSDEGKWDEAIVDLCNKINEMKNYYTTSSCSGRIILIKSVMEKKPNLFLFKTHNKISFNDFKKKLEEAVKKYKGIIYFKQEPCLLHVACKDMESAKKLLYSARQAGWKRSGIIASGKRIVCELMSTEHIETPIAQKGKMMVNEKFINLLIKEANKKLERTRNKIKRFEEYLKRLE